MNLSDLELLLKQVVGLDVSSVGPSMIARAVQTRMKACGASDMEHYGSLLRTSLSEMQELIETVVVPETWFFRDEEAFATLHRVAQADWSSLAPDETFRILSLPCSTGEEPYSVAMTLFNAGLTAQRFRIDAIDISGRALQQARRGRYGKNSFRGQNLDFRNQYFDSHADGWQLTEKVRQQVHFEQGNLIDPTLLPGTHLYDAIFCRNVLIYFDLPGQERAIATLDRLLRPDGLLFMGPSETSSLPPHRFVSARLTHAFAFRKPKAGSLLPKEKLVVKTSTARPKPPASLPAKPAPPVQPKPRPLVPLEVTLPARANSLDEVMLLADQGRLKEAWDKCETHLRQEGPSARAYYLSGLIHDANQQQREAVEFYRKALYLDPVNEEIMAHLGSLLKAQGDIAGARLVLNRARRVIQRQKA